MPFPKLLLKKRLCIGLLITLVFGGVYIYVQFMKVSLFVVDLYNMYMYVLIGLSVFLKQALRR